jgi:transposase
VGEIVGMSYVSVNSWLKRYKREGISGLRIKKGRGRKPLLDLQSDLRLGRTGKG